jgi:hypothetical protein
LISIDFILAAKRGGCLVPMGISYLPIYLLEVGSDQLGISNRDVKDMTTPKSILCQVTGGVFDFPSANFTMDL